MVSRQCKKLTFSVDSKYLLPCILGRSKNYIPSTNFCGHVTGQLPPIVRFMTQTTLHIMVKGIDNALLTIWNCVSLVNRRNISVKIGLFFQEITFITEFPGSIFSLPKFLTSGKWDFQGANLLLATVNFEPCLLFFPSIFYTRVGRKTLRNSSLPL